MAGWKTERSYSGKSPGEIYQATRKVIDDLSGKYGLKHKGDEAALAGTVSGKGVDGTYKAVGDKMVIELNYAFFFVGALREKVQVEVTRQLDRLFA